MVKKRPFLIKSTSHKKNLNKYCGSSKMAIWAITNRSLKSRDFCSEGGLVGQRVVLVHIEGFEVVQHIND